MLRLSASSTAASSGDGPSYFRMGLRVLLLFAVLSLLLTISYAQVTSGTMYGTIKDPSGALVPGATVTVHSDAIGVTRTVTGSSSGEFVVPNLPPGTYSVTVEAQGFKALKKEGVILNAADKLNAGEFELAVGAAGGEVTVTADAAQLQLQSNSGERSDVVTGKQLNDLALNGRNPLDFMKVVPGVISSVDAQTAGTGHLNEFSVNGTRKNQHEFTIDGASNVDTGDNGNTHVTINPDSIAEMKILTSNYQAEFGKAGGGQIAVVTRGGTSEFHGNVRFFHRNEGMNANDWFNDHYGTPIQKYRYNNIGYQIGGPVLLPWTDFNKKRDKLYFFFGQEYYRQLIPAGGVTQIRVPTALERTGDFSQTLDGDGNLLTIYNPNTGLPFAGNKIDPSQLTAQQQAVFGQVSKILSLYSLPNVSGNNNFNYQYSPSYDAPRREDTLRIDYQLNSSNRFFGRWINNAQVNETPLETWNLNCMGSIQFPGGCVNKNPSWNLSLDLVSTITPTLLNEFSIGPSVNRSEWYGNNGNLSRGANGIDLPLLYGVTSDTNIPDISFGGNNGLWYPWSYLGANPWFQANTTININDNLTKVIHNHTLKAGIFMQRARKDQIAWGNYNGQISTNNCATSASPTACPNASGNAYASALLGYFSSFDQTSARPTGYFRYWNTEFYLQDTWKVNSRLTLDYGMRFAWYQPQYDDNNQLAIFDPASYDPSKAVRLYTCAQRDGSGNCTGVYDPASPTTIIANSALYGTIVPGSGSLDNGVKYASAGYYQGGWQDRGIMPEPRIGFAYSPFDSGKTVVRGGFGMMHDRIQGNLIFNPVFNNPANVVTPTILNGNLANLPNMGSQGIIPTFGGIVGAEPSGKVPTVYSYSLGIQQDIGWGMTLDVAYVGTLSRHLVTARDINAIPYGTTFTAAAQDPTRYSGGAVPGQEPGLPAGYTAAGYNFSGANSYDTEFLVPYKGYGNIEYYKFDGTANYNSLQVSAQRKFSRGLAFGVAYTWSKALTTAAADEDWQDPFFPRNDYRAADWDRTHVLAINYVYDIPGLVKHLGGPKWLSYLTDGYEFSGISNFETGVPVNSSIWIPANTLTGSNQWGKVPPVYLGSSCGCWDPNALVAPTIGQPYFGTRDTMRQGGLQNWDMSIFKNFPLGNSEQRYIQLRAEAFNVFNHPNFDTRNVDVNVADPFSSSTGTYVVTAGSSFGQNKSEYQGLGGARKLQLAVKLYF